MSEIPSDHQHPHGVEVPPPPPEEIPRWVPVLIGVVLVALASFAVITGLRYRDNTLVSIVNPRGTRQRTPSPAPPGEPEAGASLVMSGDSGANVPQANEPVSGPSRAEVTGGPSGVNAVVRMWARRGMQVKAEPADAVVSVNNVVVGQASQFDSEDEIYDFPAAGSYNVKLHADGFMDRHYVVTASNEADAEVARIEAKLETRAQGSGLRAQKPNTSP